MTDNLPPVSRSCSAYCSSDVPTKKRLDWGSEDWAGGGRGGAGKRSANHEIAEKGRKSEKISFTYRRRMQASEREGTDGGARESQCRGRRSTLLALLTCATSSWSTTISSLSSSACSVSMRAYESDM